MPKLVYFFGSGKAEGNASMRSELGGKGANLAEMTNMGIPVPAGFTISTDVCKAYYDNHKKYPAELKAEVAKNLAHLEKSMGKKLGNAKDPLLVSVRSGAAVSMPGMMDTILNLGLNDDSVQGLAHLTSNPRFAWDAYRRFIQMFGDVAMGVPHSEFESAISLIKAQKHVKLDTELDASDLEKLVGMYKEIYKKHTGSAFPQNPVEQMWHAIDAVFSSWMNERAIKYRQLNSIKGLKGTAVTIMSMVFGNMGTDSGTGVCFSRSPSTGENKFFGEYLMNAQGEDVVAGIRTPQEIDQLNKENPKVYKQLIAIRDKLEKHYHDMQDMEFTVQQGTLYFLQCRNGKRTGAAAVRMAIDMVKEKLITKETAITRVEPAQLDQLLHPMINTETAKKFTAIASGLNASPGAGCGQIVFTAEEAEKQAQSGKKVLLVRKETSPDDIAGMNSAQGILTATGGRTSHAAVVARQMGKPCVSGVTELLFNNDGSISLKGKNFKAGDWITIDGTSGNVYEGQIPLTPAKISDDLDIFMKWCDEIRNNSVRKIDGHVIKSFGVRANADQPDQAQKAFDFGAEGVGLCRTEHMFFDPEKLIYFQAMIASDTTEIRIKALQKILPLQQKDFTGIFEAMKGKPVTIRFLDPPLHEFIPKDEEGTKKVQRVLAEEGTTIGLEELTMKFNSLKEFNPMLGHRGCRLTVTYPEIYEMQTEAVTRAAIDCKKRGISVKPQIMIPIVCDPFELTTIRSECERVIASIESKGNVKINIEIGTMIEVPRAALLSNKIVRAADFYSFGTNDLTQMTFAFSRDDASKFLGSYYSRNLLENDPFKTLDTEGVGQLMTMAVQGAREVKPDFHCGICGEHGGDPATIDFCYKIGLNYVSCSPYRVPIARLAAAQAVIENAAKPAPKAKTASKKPPAKKAAAKKAAANAKVPAKKPAVKKSAIKAKAPVKKIAAKKPVAKAKAPAKKPAAKKNGRKNK